MSKHNYFKINEIVNAPFNYVISTGPIDYFRFTLSKEQLTENIKYDVYDFKENEEDCSFSINGYHFQNIDELENYIIDFVSNIEEKPHTIRYSGIPCPDNCDFDLVVIAKISNNGTCFIFSNNKDFLKLIND